MCKDNEGEETVSKPHCFVSLCANFQRMNKIRDPELKAIILENNYILALDDLEYGAW